MERSNGKGKARNQVFCCFFFTPLRFAIVITSTVYCLFTTCSY